MGVEICSEGGLKQSNNTTLMLQLDIGAEPNGSGQLGEIRITPKRLHR